MAQTAMPEFCAGTDGEQSSRLADRIRQVLRATRKPVSAYQLTELLQQQTGFRHFPNSVYRALRSLAAEGEVLQVVSVNGWLYRATPPCSSALLLLCKGCGGAQQIALPELDTAIAHIGNLCSFKILQSFIEVEGMCENCGLTPALPD